MTDTTTPHARIERTFDAPIDEVWRMWVEPSEFAAWYGPPGAEIPVCEMDVKEGGRRFVGMRMQGPDGEMQMWFVGAFVEITAPTRLVYTESLANADGDALSPEESGMPPGAPSDTQVTVELQAIDDDRTAVVVRHVGIPADSPGAMGWQMALDKLAAHLDD